MDELPADISRPVILYVERVDTNPSIDAMFETRRLSVLDLELDPIAAQQINDYITERMECGTPGSIRLRFTGRLIHL